MLITIVLLCLVSVAALSAAVLKGRETRRDEARLSGYITSLRAVAADHRARIADLEVSLQDREQQLAAQERLLDGQAAHLRTLDTRYVG